jgi:hypothetical protein
MQDALISLTCANQPTFKLRDINALQNLTKTINSKKNLRIQNFRQNAKIVDGQKHMQNTKSSIKKKPLENFYKKNRYEKKFYKIDKIQKVSGKRSQPTTSLYHHQG